MNAQEAKQVAILAKELMSPSHKWNKNSMFEEKCLINSTSFTLGCALELMQLSVMGESRSRSLVMRRVRWKIRGHFIWRHGWHPITNFNRHPRTSYNDVMFLLDEVIQSL